MEEPLVKIHYWLYPISWIYGMGVRLRNKLFDWGYYRSRSFDVPVVCVGNLAVGGTGKTPHTEDPSSRHNKRNKTLPTLGLAEG